MELKFEPFNPVVISKDEKLPIKVRDAISQKEYYLCKVKTYTSTEVVENELGETVSTRECVNEVGLCKNSLFDEKYVPINLDYLERIE